MSIYLLDSTLVRERSEEAISYFQDLCNREPNHPNGEYALAVALIETGRRYDALPHLKKALTLAKAEKRRRVLARWLEELHVDT